MKAFYYKDELYFRIIPAKRLFNSTTIYEVVNRGDVFALRVKDSVFTIIPGNAEVTHVDMNNKQHREDVPTQIGYALAKSK